VRSVATTPNPVEARAVGQNGGPYPLLLLGSRGEAHVVLELSEMIPDPSAVTLTTVLHEKGPTKYPRKMQDVTKTRTPTIGGQKPNQFPPLIPTSSIAAPTGRNTSPTWAAPRIPKMISTAARSQ
jgi:hypothetical protein